jgi:hypothetical protein
VRHARLMVTVAWFILVVASPQAETVIAPNGKRLHMAKCQSSPSSCYAQATETCRGPYQVLDSESHAGGLLADILPGPVTWYSFLYQCGRSDGRTPGFEFRGPQWRPPAYVNCWSAGYSTFCYGN